MLFLELPALDDQLADGVLDGDDVEQVQARIQDSERALATLRGRLERCVRLGAAPCAPARADEER